VRKGEQALNIQINARPELVSDAHGSFHIAQMMCRETCLSAGILERCGKARQPLANGRCALGRAQCLTARDRPGTLRQ
jgi:hypothetical protein